MDEIEIAEPDPDWPLKYLAERVMLKQTLPDGQVLAIEHFGSTAVPGLAAKPVIDILVAVVSLDEARSSFSVLLKYLGYVFWADNPHQDRLFFVKGMPPYGERRTHHLHVAERPGEMWDRLKFRDYLREYPEEVSRYGALKRDLARTHRTDREAYTEAKDEFIETIMNRITG